MWGRHPWRGMEKLRSCSWSIKEVWHSSFATKTVICPKSIIILGWVWWHGSIAASTHRGAALASCPPPETVRGLRSFIGAYKMLSRVLPQCSHLIAPLEEKIGRLQSTDKIVWSNTQLDHLKAAQKALDTDGSATKHGIGATLYVHCEGILMLAGFFSAKLRKHQVSWIPCEIESLSIAASVKHFSAFIIQSQLQVSALIDSKSCVQGFEKLCRGEFSSSPRVTTFLS